MKQKTLGLMCFGIFAFALLLSFTSAASLDISNKNIPTSINHDNGSFQITFDVTNTGSADNNVSFDGSFITSGTATIQASDFAIADGSTTPATMNLVVTINYDAHQSGSIAGIIEIDDSGAGTPKNFAFLVSINNSPSLSLSSSTIPIGEDSTTITIKNEGNTVLSNIQLTASGDFDVTIFPSSISSLTAGATQNVKVTMTTTGNLEIGENEITITATASDDTSATGIVSAEQSFCECGNQGDLKLNVEDVKVIEGFGDDDDFWYLFDKIEVELQIDNDGDWDIDNIEIEWALYTTSGKKIMDDTLNDFNLKNGKDETVIFSFVLDENIDEFENEDAVLYIKAKGDIDDNDSPYDGNETCDSESVDVEVRADDDFVILSDVKINGMDLNEFILDESTISCNQEVIVTADVWNIGSDDQEDVGIVFYDQELGINEKIEIGDIDAFENEEINFKFVLPEKLEEKWHRLDIRIFDDGNDLFENSEDDQSLFTIRFEVAGNCNLNVAPSINAELVSEAKENSELIIKIYVKNNDDESATYTLNAAGYADWASLTTISESTITLNAGEAKEVMFTFETKKDTVGDRFFNLEVLSDGQIVSTQPIVISIEKGKAANFKDFFENNWKLLGIGLLNLILIIAIIIVAVKTYRR